MPHVVPIPHGMFCHAEGSMTVSSSSTSLPANIFEKMKGKDMEVLLGIETDQIRMALSGADADSASMLYEVGDKPIVAGVVAIRNLRMIRVTADATVRYQAFSRPI